MGHQRTRIVAAIAAVGALIAAAVIVLPAQATPPSPGVTTTMLGQSRFDEIHIQAHARTPELWKAQLKTHGQSDVYVVDNKIPPGGTPAGIRIRVPA